MVSSGVDKPYDYRDRCLLYFVPPIDVDERTGRKVVPREVQIEINALRCLDVARTLLRMGALRVVIIPIAYYQRADDGKWLSETQYRSWECNVVPEEVKAAVRASRFEEHADKLRFHPGDGFWSFTIAGMFVGVEPDGYIHT
jgi:hypothetical protein